MRIHRGISTFLFRKVLSSIFLASTIAPKNCKLILQATENVPYASNSPFDKGPRISISIFLSIFIDFLGL